MKWFREWAGMIKESTGCPNSRFKIHRYGWSLGPEVPVKIENGLQIQESYFGGPGEWWMYCEHCGKKAWDD